MTADAVVQEPGAQMADHPSRRRPSPAGLALAAAVLLGLAACATPEVVRPDAAAQAAGQTAPAGQATPPPAEPVDLATFATIDRATWATIAADPVAAAGQQVVVYGVVERVFTSTGPGVLQASVTTAQPADAAEGTPAIVRAQPDQVADVVVGDVIRVYAQVAGSFGGASGATARTPELVAAAVEEVGPRDLAADVRLGTATTGGGGVTIPVTITNSADVSMSYLVEVNAASADGARNYGSVVARGDALAPGQAAESGARFTGALPADVVFALTSITRTPVTP